MNLDGTNRLQLTHGAQRKGWPAISADGTQLAYGVNDVVTTKQGNATITSPVVAIHVASASDGSLDHAVTDGTHLDLNPTFGPPGTIYFDRGEDKPPAQILAERSTDGGQTWSAPVTLVEGTQPSYNASLGLVACTVASGQDFSFGYIDVRSGTPTKVTVFRRGTFNFTMIDIPPLLPPALHPAVGAASSASAVPVPLIAAGSAGIVVVGAGGLLLMRRRRRRRRVGATLLVPRPLPPPNVLYQVGGTPLKKRCEEQEAARDLAQTRLAYAKEQLDKAETVSGAAHSAEGRDRSGVTPQSPMAPLTDVEFWTPEVALETTRLADAQRALDECMSEGFNPVPPSNADPGPEEGLDRQEIG
jgi:hypothetical protein